MEPLYLRQPCAIPDMTDAHASLHDTRRLSSWNPCEDVNRTTLVSTSVG